MKSARHWILVAGLGVVTAVASAQTPTPPSPRRVVRIAAERFAFTPSEVKMAPGEEIEIRLTSDDTTHGFRIVGQDVDVKIPKRGQGEAIVTFKAPGPGRYTFECSHVCGAGHSFMRGVIDVKERR